MFEGIDDSSDDESLGSFEGTGDEDEIVVGPFEVAGEEVGRVVVTGEHGPDKTKGEDMKCEKEQEGEASKPVVV